MTILSWLAGARTSDRAAETNARTLSLLLEWQFFRFWRLQSGGLEGDYCDFGGAVEAEGQAYGADAAVDVELHLVEAVVAFGVLLGPWGAG